MIKSVLTHLVAFSISIAFADQKPTLNLGDPAPPLKVGKWLRGQPVDSFEKGKVYVLDFWGTRCHPCISGFPHLSELAKQYEGRITFIGIALRRSNNFEYDSLDSIETFMKTPWARPMTYNVCADTPDGNMVQKLFAPLGLNGIPQAIVINQDSKIVWIGDPDLLDPVLPRVMAGDIDILAERAKTIDLDKRLNDIYSEYGKLIKAKEYKKIVRLLDESIRSIPCKGYTVAFRTYRFQALNHVDPALVLPYVKQCLAEDPKHENFLLSSLTEPGYRPECYRFAITGLKAELRTEMEPWDVAQDIASAYYHLGDKGNAIKHFQLATKLVDSYPQLGAVNIRRAQFLRKWYSDKIKLIKAGKPLS